jgi:hypothetical protein
MEITRLAIAAILTVGSALAMPATAVACDCTQARIDPNYRGLIIHGRVIKMDLLQGTNTVMVQLAVQRVLSGAWTGNTIRGYGTTFGVLCEGYDFKLGQEYVVLPVSLPEDARRNVLNAPPTALYFGGLCGPTLDLRTRRGLERLQALELSLKTTR